MAHGVASPGDAVQLFLIGPVLVVMLILLFRLGFWVARLTRGIWNHFRPHQGQPPSDTLASDLPRDPPDHDPVSYLSLPETQPSP